MGSHQRNHRRNHRITVTRSRGRIFLCLFRCIPCDENEIAIDNICEVDNSTVIPEPGISTSPTGPIILTPPTIDPTRTAAATNTPIVTNLNCRASQVIEDGVCTYCAIDFVINQNECVPCNFGESNVDNVCSDKGISSYQYLSNFRTLSKNYRWYSYI